MGARHPNPRRIKIHRPYRVEEIASALGVHKNTVRHWARDGLHSIDRCRPALFRGIDVVAFLKMRRVAAKRPCGPGEIYCFKCRQPQTPAGLIADLEVSSPRKGCLVGICPACGTMMYRRVNPATIDHFKGNLEVLVRKAEASIADTSTPKLNGDFKGQARP
jgi:hypothetical protein